MLKIGDLYAVELLVDLRGSRSGGLSHVPWADVAGLDQFGDVNCVQFAENIGRVERMDFRAVQRLTLPAFRQDVHTFTR